MRKSIQTSAKLLLLKWSLLYSLSSFGQMYNVVFSELMVKPAPTVGLPNVEYIELYNRTDSLIRLKNWTLRIGNSNRTLPDSAILPKSYLLICANANRQELSVYGSVMGLSSLQLADGGQNLVLLNEKQQQIDYVGYKDSWYQDKNKAQGGWSLEKINMDYPCSEEENWTASKASAGGTPGAENSVSDKNAVPFSEIFIRNIIYVRDKIVVHFSSPLPPEDLERISNYKIAPFTEILSAKAVYPELKSVELELRDTLRNRKIYTLELQNALFNCVGNSIPERTFSRFGLPEPVDSGDIIINEILFHPFTRDDSEYLELYNRSDKVLDLGTLQISYQSSGAPSAAKSISDGFLLFSKEYAVLTKNTENIKTNYFCKYPLQLVSCSNLPTFSNTGGTIFLYNQSLQLIDKIEYSAKMHHPLLTSENGVALERIYPDQPTSDAKNWTSAAATVGFGTPTYQNSQYRDFERRDRCLAYPEVFSPDGDGFDDFCTVSLFLEDAECIGSVVIYNTFGQKVRTLCNHEILGTEAYFVWDGLNDAQQRLETGTYVVLLDYKSPEGKRKQLKTAVVLAVKLK